MTAAKIKAWSVRSGASWASCQGAPRAVKWAASVRRARLTIETPAGNKVVIDDDAGAITLADQHGSTITLDSGGITLRSAADLSLDASGQVVIKGSTVDVQ